MLSSGLAFVGQQVLAGVIASWLSLSGIKID
jgi:hypothetical protein